MELPYWGGQNCPIQALPNTVVNDINVYACKQQWYQMLIQKYILHVKVSLQEKQIGNRQPVFYSTGEDLYLSPKLCQEFGLSG